MCARRSPGHELRCFVAGKAKHHPLVARADAVEGVGRAVLRLIGFIDAHGDVGRLHIDRCDNAAGIAVKSIFVVAITDIDGHIAGDRRNIHVAFCRNLTHDVQHPGCRRHLAGNMRTGVLLQNRIQYRVRNLVAEFIGMPSVTDSEVKNIFAMLCLSSCLKIASLVHVLGSDCLLIQDSRS